MHGHSVAIAGVRPLRVSCLPRSVSYRGGMDQDRARRGFAVAETDDIDALRARIRELEAELRTRPATGTKDARGGGDAIKVVAAGLGASTVLLAAPAFVTFRRWVRWWLS